MNLAEYEKLDTGFNKGDYIKFEKNGETRYLRFLYESGGEKMGEDVKFRRKYWDEDNKKFVYDTDEGQLVCPLKVIEYDADGKNPRIKVWERSAYFCKTVLLPMWKNYPRIIDGVWKVTATNPKTLEASYALFPVMNADTISFPIIEANEKTEGKPKEEPKKAEPAPKKKYWE